MINISLLLENIMLKYPDDLTSIRIADFGTATYIHIEDNSYCGTCLYMPPEMLQGKAYDQSVDIWACGIIMYILSSGGMHPVYYGDMKGEDYTAELLKLKEWNFTNDFPLLARNLFLKLCKIDKMYRFESHKILRHPWITRSSQGEIPQTLIESYRKIDLTKKFKCVSGIRFIYNPTFRCWHVVLCLNSLEKCIRSYSQM